MGFQRSKTMTWAIAFVYGLLVFAGEALHLLPGCCHHHDLAGNSHGSRCRSSCEQASPDRCSHGCHHDHKRNVAETKSTAVKGNRIELQVVDEHHNCQVCKLMASLASHVQPLSGDVVQFESLCDARVCMELSLVGNAPACLCIRGPPASVTLSYVS